MVSMHNTKYCAYKPAGNQMLDFGQIIYKMSKNHFFWILKYLTENNQLS